MAFVKMQTSLVSFVQLLQLLLLICSASPSIAWEDPQVEWLRTKPNGFFSEKISWQRLDPNDPTSAYGMFASEDIPKDESLIVIPQSLLITSKGSGMNCDTVTMLLEELEKGKDSDYFPYIDYLFGDGTKRGKLPHAWSELGQALLEKIIGDSLQPPSIDHHEPEMYCPDILEDSENASQIELDAYLFMISRSWDDVMIPSKLSYTLLRHVVLLSCVVVADHKHMDLSMFIVVVVVVIFIRYFPISLLISF